VRDSLRAPNASSCAKADIQSLKRLWIPVCRMNPLEPQPRRVVHRLPQAETSPPCHTPGKSTPAVNRKKPIRWLTIRRLLSALLTFRSSTNQIEPIARSPAWISCSTPRATVTPARGQELVQADIDDCSGLRRNRERSPVRNRIDRGLRRRQGSRYSQGRASRAIAIVDIDDRYSGRATG
jgi:hypothetical protein